MKHILIVEDDTILNETLSFNLQQKDILLNLPKTKRSFNKIKKCTL